MYKLQQPEIEPLTRNYYAGMALYHARNVASRGPPRMSSQRTADVRNGDGCNLLGASQSGMDGATNLGNGLNRDGGIQAPKEEPICVCRF